MGVGTDALGCERKRMESGQALNREGNSATRGTRGEFAMRLRGGGRGIKEVPFSRIVESTAEKKRGGR